MLARWLTAVGIVAAASLGLAACGGSHARGIASRSPDAIVSAATQAIDGARTVRVSGLIPSGGAPIRLDLQLVNGRGAVGSMSEDGESFRLVVVGSTIYIDGGDAFWRSFGGAAVAARLRGRWLRAPESSTRLSSLAALTDLRELVGALLRHHGALVVAGRTTVDGEPVIALRDARHDGTLDVATSGPPYPIRIAGTSDVGPGVLRFADFDAPVALTAPATSIAIPSLTR